MQGEEQAAPQGRPAAAEVVPDTYREAPGLAAPEAGRGRRLHAARRATKVAVAGATGKVGREIVQTILGTPGEFQLVGALALEAGRDVGEVVGLPAAGATIDRTIEEVLRKRPDVLVDFTHPEAGARHLLAALEAGVRPVFGTTSIPKETLQAAFNLAADKGIGGAVIPNFSIGALLLARLAREAARFFPSCEIIELHHDTKKDRPSGTARRMAEDLHSRTGVDVPVHSVRLPGLVAHHEIIFGSSGELLTLRHDTISRASFVPGVLMTVRAAMQLDHMVGSLEEVLEVLGQTRP